MKRYAVNPQKHGLAIACFVDARLEWARYCEPVHLGSNFGEELFWLGGILTPYGPDQPRLVIEQMHVYPAARQKGDQNDLIALASVVGAVCSGAPWGSIRLVEPREWNGGLPKEVIRDRAIKRLSEVEFSRVELRKSKKLALDVWAAVGIGLFDLGRLRSQRIITRGIE